MMASENWNGTKMVVPAGQIGRANCCYASPLNAGLQFGCALDAQSYSPAAVIELDR